MAYINDFFQMINWWEYWEIIIKILLSCILGGVIGFEREFMNRPAGFRTHILVCVGASLVMITSEFIFNTYSGLTTLDPGRLGAQVISGIGFLGAGTIIREGVTVKGLTTAASLWAVACIGLAVGIGFYSGAIVATIAILLSLVLFKRIEDNITKKNRQDVLYISLEERERTAAVIAAVGGLFSSKSVVIKNISFKDDGVEGVTIKFNIKRPYNYKKGDLIIAISKIEGIESAR